MSSQEVFLKTSDTLDSVPTTENLQQSVSEFLTFHEDNKSLEDKENIAPVTKPSSKRKRKPEENISLNVLFEVFLRILYPISRCMTKSIAIGLLKPSDYSPNVILNHGAKVVIFSEKAWESFMKHLHLIECYLTNNMFGKKTAVRLMECNIEVDIIKSRGDLNVRFRNLNKHEEKIILTREEFYILTCVSSPITRYMRQLVFSSSVIKDYLVDTMEKQPDIPILHGPVDTSIFNRIPHEVEVWRRLKEYEFNLCNQDIEQLQENEEILAEESKG
jgi:hypothetical protein